MNKLEKKLNKLIELGWKPFNIKHSVVGLYEGPKSFLNIKREDEGGTFSKKYSLNDLISIDSGLWQFVVEKGLYVKKPSKTIRYTIKDGEFEKIQILNISNSSLRAMLSSIQEDKVKFLIDNIQVK